MNTIILFWNPAISSYTIERLREDMSNYAHVSNWSVWEHDKAHKGDRFFMVRCGKGKTGICMSGRFRSEPYQDEDWSGKGREVYYMDLMADTVIDPDLLPILSTEVLTENIPSFNWSGGHSGRLLPAEEAEKLEQLWAEFLDEHEHIFGKLALKEYISDADFEEEEEDETCKAEIELSLGGGFEIFSPDGEVTVEGYNLNSLKEEFVQKMKEAGNTKPIEFHFEFIDDQNLFSKVLDIADDAYAGMNDEFGVPYMKRAIKEVKPLYTDASIIVGLLQYVFRNPQYTPKMLTSKGIPKVIVNTIVTLQKKEKEDFEHYIERVGETPAAASILYEILEDSLYIHELPELTTDKFTNLAQNLKAFHYLEDKLAQNKRVTFSGPAKDFEMWCSLNDSAAIFAIRGDYGDRSVALMSRVLSKLSNREFYVDISELNIHREAKYDRLIRTYEDDIMQRLYYDEEISLLEKMIINRKYGNVFEKDGRKFFCDNGKVLVHIPVDQEFEISDTVEIIGRAAVIGNKTLKTLEFPSNVHEIDDYAFAYCEDLSIVKMHDKIASIGENSFDSCSIKQLRLSSSLSEIPAAAFKYNEDLEAIEIPANVKHIREEAFLCDYVEDVVIPEGVETIDYAVFTRTLRYVSLPSTLKWIAYDFYYEYGIDDPERTKPYVDIHPDNPVYFSKGGILYSRETGQEVLGRAGRLEKE
jgi:hypothetical protein